MKLYDIVWTLSTIYYSVRRPIWLSLARRPCAGANAEKRVGPRERHGEGRCNVYDCHERASGGLLTHRGKVYSSLVTLVHGHTLLGHHTRDQLGGSHVE